MLYLNNINKMTPCDIVNNPNSLLPRTYMRNCDNNLTIILSIFKEKYFCRF